MAILKIKTKLTPLHHAGMMFAVFGAVILASSTYSAKQLDPELDELTVDLEDKKNNIAYLERYIKSKDSPDISVLRQRIAEAEQKLRELNFRAVGGKPFVNTAKEENAESLLGVVAQRARARGIIFDENLSADMGRLGKQFDGLSNRKLKFSGGFQQLYGLIQDINAMPYRIMILDLSISEPAEELGGALSISMMLSF
ncbi:MAG: hypothetical protein MK183_08275 [Verrucomicrobiales bacterium]|nr:hypothetical protein [Verrucomicrobiales bacterium]